MKTLLLLLLSVAAASAQNITKVTTLIIKNDPGQTNAIPNGNGTNWISIPAGEAARVSSIQLVTMGFPESNFANYYYVRDGWYWDAAKGDVVEGPVFFVIELTADANSAARMTLERWKVAKR